MLYGTYGFPVIQYTGSNSAEIVTAFEEVVSTSVPVPNITIQSESGGILVLHSDYDGQNLATTLNIGDWTRITGTGGGDVVTNEDFVTKWTLF